MLEGVATIVMAVTVWSISQVLGSNLCIRDGKLIATVLSQEDTRFAHTKKVLQDAGFEVQLHKPEPYNSTNVMEAFMKEFGGSPSITELKVLSNLRAFEQAIDSFATGNAGKHDWMFFVEDDVALHPSLSGEQAELVIQKGQALALLDGILYLGICGPTCDECSTTMESGATFQRCQGTCAHFFGVTKAKAQTLMLLLQHFKPVSGKPLSIYFDQLLRLYGGLVHEIWVAGTDLRSPHDKGHRGIFFQDRQLFRSSIGG